MPEFLQSTAGRAVLGAVIAVAIVLILDLNYRFFVKSVFDFIFSLIAVIVCSPVLIVGAFISNKRAKRVFEYTPVLGTKGKIVYLTSFAGFEGGIKNLPRLLDVLSGKLSFVGVKPLEVVDGTLMDDEQMERFSARPGIVCHTAFKGGEGTTYEEMFALDMRYAKKRELFLDIFIVLKCFAAFTRGEGKNYLGEAKDKSYAEVKLARGEISEEDFTRAKTLASETLSQTSFN